MSAQDFPISTPYGWVQDYPLHTNPIDPAIPLIEKAKYPGAGYGFHTGIDYGCPDGTEIVVNGVVIGLSGHTGAAFGPHLHLGRFVGGNCTNPTGRGFTFDNAVVTQVAQDASNGKYVRIRGDGVDYIYDHLSNNSLVSVGQVLKGEEKMLSEDEWYMLFRGMLGRDPTQAEAAGFTRDPHLAIQTLWNNGAKQRYETPPSGTKAEVLPKGVYEVRG